MILGLKSAKVQFSMHKGSLTVIDMMVLRSASWKMNLNLQSYPAFFIFIGPLFFRFSNGHIFKFKIQIPTIKNFSKIFPKIFTLDLMKIHIDDVF